MFDALATVVEREVPDNGLYGNYIYSCPNKASNKPRGLYARYEQ